MKVKTLIKKLEKLPQDSEVVSVYCMSEVLKCCGVDFDDEDDFGLPTGGKVVLSFK